MTFEQLVQTYGHFALTYAVFAIPGFLVARAALWYVMSLMRPWHWRTAMDLLGFLNCCGILLSVNGSLILFKEEFGLVSIAIAAIAGQLLLPLIMLTFFLIAKGTQFSMTKIDDALRRKFGSLTDETTKQ